MPSYVQEARSRFLAWRAGDRDGLAPLEDYLGEVPFVVFAKSGLTLLWELYREQPEVRKAWFHLAQAHWNQGTEVLHDVVPVAIWKALAKDRSATLEARQEWLRKYQIARRANYLRLAKGKQDWMGYWPTALQGRLDQRFPKASLSNRTNA